MIEELIGSPVKARVLALLRERGGDMHVSAIARELGVSKSYASECLRALAEAGLLDRRRIGRSVAYRLSPTRRAQSVVEAISGEPLHREIEQAIASGFRPLKPVSVILFGSAVRSLRAGSDVDVLIVHDGSAGSERIAPIAARLTERFGFHISVVQMSASEFRRKARKGEEFVLNVMAHGRVLAGRSFEEVVWRAK